MALAICLGSCSRYPALHEPPGGVSDGPPSPDASEEPVFTCDLGQAAPAEPPEPVEPECIGRTPRPVAPLPGATATTRRPLLRWVSPQGVPHEVHVDLCRDRGCANPLASFSAETGTLQPNDALPPGVIFWRVADAGCAGPTWWFRIPTRDSPVNTSSGTALDVDGDGHADVVATSRDARAFVFRGGPEGLSPAPAAVLGEPGCPRHDWVAAPAGDVDGDGYIDLVVGSRGIAVYLCRGGPTGIEQSPSFTMEAPEDTPGFARDVAWAGDVDGDGYGDFIVGSGAPVRGVPAAYLFRGSSEGPHLPPAELWSGPDTFGNYSVTGAGDVDGDGHGDVAVGSLIGNHVRVYHGSPDGLAPEPTVKLYGVGTYYGYELAPAGDIDGDGYADLLVGAANPGIRGRVYVYRGGPTGTSEEPIVLESEEGRFGFSTAGGDLDADGFADVVVGESEPGKVYIYRGAPGPGALGVSYEPHTTPGGFAWPLAVVGDIDGDGNLDFAVGDFSTGAVYLFRGSPDGVAGAPQVLQVEGVRGFGFSVGSGVGG